MAVVEGKGTPAGELLPIGPARSVALAAADDERVLLLGDVPAAVAELLACSRRGCTLVVEDVKALLHAFGLDRVVGDLREADVCDVQLASYVLDPSRRAHSIDALANDRLHRTLAARTDGDLATRSADVATALVEIGPGLLADLEASGLAGLYRDPRAARWHASSR